MKRLPRWPVEVCAVLVPAPRAPEDAPPAPCYRRFTNHGPAHDRCACEDERAAHLGGDGHCTACHPRCPAFVLALEEHTPLDDPAAVEAARAALAERDRYEERRSA